MTIGAWKSYYELEDNLTLNELTELYGSLLEEEQQQYKRDASLQGIDLEKGNSNSAEQELERRYREHVAKKRGEEVSEVNLPGIGYMQL